MESELFLSILSSMAEEESTSISENNKWSAKKRFENGTYKLSYASYGYCLVNGKLTIDKTQAEIVKQIFTELLSGKGTEAIAKILNQEQIPSQKGGRWTSAVFVESSQMKNIPVTAFSKKPTQTVILIGTKIMAHLTDIIFLNIMKQLSVMLILMPQML